MVILILRTFAGTARLVEIVWLIQNNCDVQKVKAIPSTQRHLYMEACDPTYQKMVIRDKPLPPPEGQKIVKSHLPYEMLAKHVARSGVKVVMGLRNPKDTLVSYYHFHKMTVGLGCYKGTFDEFFEVYKNNRLAYGDPIDFSLSWWNQRHRDNIHVCTFEDIEDLLGAKVIIM